jgi:AAA15 family ATPase/GTPase
MLVEFSVTNYRSIFEETTLSMVASKKKSREPQLDSQATFELGEGSVRLLKCAAIYGANGAGKSNIFRALGFMKSFVTKSANADDIDAEIECTPFLLNENSAKEPSKFRMVFVIGKITYEYGFAVTPAHIVEEWLLSKTQTSARTVELFSRNNNGINVDSAFTEGSGLESKTRGNALFLSTCAQFNGSKSTEVLRWFKRLRVVSGLSDTAFLSATKRSLQTNESASGVRAVVRAFDLGFSNFSAVKDERKIEDEFDSMPTEMAGLAAELKKLVSMSNNARYRISTTHPVFDSKGNKCRDTEFDLEQDESEGTKKLVSFSGPLSDSLSSQCVLVIDEFDARLHPLITKQIIRMFNGTNTNSTNAQLIVATHDTNLLDKDLLRRDQIWFVEKDVFGASHLTSLVEYKVRNDASYEKDYILGKYGAIPFLGSIDHVFPPTRQKIPKSEGKA